MKYIQIFEAFESSRLSGILKYINDPNSKKNFLELLKDLSNKLDFPLSEFQDSDFQYMNWTKALELKHPNPSGKVAGIGGFVSNLVNYDFTKTPPPDPDANKWAKFWFDSDGKFIAFTITDDGKTEYISQMGSTDIMILTGDESDFLKLHKPLTWNKVIWTDYTDVYELMDLPAYFSPTRSFAKLVQDWNQWVITGSGESERPIPHPIISKAKFALVLDIPKVLERETKLSQKRELRAQYVKTAAFPALIQRFSKVNWDGGSEELKKTLIRLLGGKWVLIKSLANSQMMEQRFFIIVSLLSNLEEAMGQARREGRDESDILKNWGSVIKSNKDGIESLIAKSLEENAKIDKLVEEIQNRLKFVDGALAFKGSGLENLQIFLDMSTKLYQYILDKPLTNKTHLSSWNFLRNRGSFFDDFKAMASAHQNWVFASESVPTVFCICDYFMDCFISDSAMELCKKDLFEFFEKGGFFFDPYDSPEEEIDEEEEIAICIENIGEDLQRANRGLERWIVRQIELDS